jgi:hypothetical protein
MLDKSFEVIESVQVCELTLSLKQRNLFTFLLYAQKEGKNEVFEPALCAINKRKGSNTKDKPHLSVQLFYTFRFRVCPRLRCLPTAGRHPYPQNFSKPNFQSIS